MPRSLTKPSLYCEHKTRHEIRSIIDHLNESFQVVFSIEPEQCIDDHITKFKRHYSLRQYLKMNPIKWGHKGWF